MTSDRTLLALDIGTSRCRATVFSTSAEVLAEASRPTPVETTGDGEAVVHPEQVWRDVTGLIREVAGRTGEVSAVGVAAQLGTVLLDERLEPLMTAMLWADRRAAGEAEELAGMAGAASLALARRPLAAELHGPRLRWLRKHEPSIAASVRHVVSLKDFIVLRLTGAVLTDETHASYSGLFDVARRRWSPELCRLHVVPIGLLPEVRPAISAAGRVTPAAAAATALAAGTPVSVGGSDGTLGTLGAGAVTAGITVDVAGTTDVLLHMAATPERAPSGVAIVNAHAVPGLWSIGGPTGMTGGAVSWMARILGHDSLGDALAALPHALDAPPTAEPPFFYPSLSGSRFPDWRAADRGSFVGLSASDGAGTLLRATAEGAAFVLRRGLSVLASAGLRIDELVVVGGLANHSGPLQLRADILGLPLRIAANSEASSIGAAMTAGIAGGSFADAGEAAAAMVRYADVIRPNPRHARTYSEKFGRWSASFGLRD